MDRREALKSGLDEFMKIVPSLLGTASGLGSILKLDAKPKPSESAVSFSKKLQLPDDVDLPGCNLDQDNDQQINV